MLSSQAAMDSSVDTPWLRRLNVSLATIYNSLHQFREAGLLREVAVDASRSYFDTDTSDHHHYYLEDEQRVIDIPASAIVISNLPEPPRGMDITIVTSANDDLTGKALLDAFGFPFRKGEMPASTKRSKKQTKKKSAAQGNS